MLPATDPAVPGLVVEEVHRVSREILAERAAQAPSGEQAPGAAGTDARR